MSTSAYARENFIPTPALYGIAVSVVNREPPETEYHAELDKLILLVYFIHR